MLRFEKYKRLEAEGVFADSREQYLLSALCRLYIWYLSSESGGSIDEIAAWFGYPSVVQMRLPTEEELTKIKKRKIEHDKKAYQGLIAFAEGQGKNVKSVSRQQFFKDFGYE